MKHEHEPHLKLYTGLETDLQPELNLNSEALAEQIVPELVELYAEFGLDNNMLAILGRHMKDMHTSISSSSTNRDIVLTTAQSKCEEEDTPGCWQRQLLIPAYKINQYEAHIRSTLQRIKNLTPKSMPRKSQHINEDGAFKPELIRTLAVKTLFAEASVDMLGNSMYMQHKFEQYIPDFNGQSAHYSCELEVPREFYKQYGNTEPTERELRTDLHALRRGIGLEFLKSDLLRTGVFSKMTYAEWAIQSLARKNLVVNIDSTAVVPHNEHDIMQRIMVLQPKFGVRKAIIEFALSIDEE